MSTRSKDFKGLLRRSGRSRQDLKEYFKESGGSVKRSTDKKDGVDARASSSSSAPKVEAPESLSLRKDTFGTSDFAHDDSISQYLALSTGPDLPKSTLGDGEKTPTVAEEKKSKQVEHPESAPPVNGSKEEAEPEGKVSTDSRETSARNAQKVIHQLREDVMREMREKETMLGKFEMLSAQNVALESRLSSQRMPTPKLEEEGKKVSDADRKLREEREREHAEILEDRDHLKERLTNVQAKMKSQEEEIEKLRERQVLHSGQETGKSMKTPESTEDGALGGEMGKLAFDIQDWITRHFRRTKLDLSDLPADFEEVVVQVVGRRKAVAGIAKIGFFQALASACLIEIFQDDFFFALPPADEYASLRTACQFLNDTARTNEFTQWRSFTVGILRERHDDQIEESTKDASDLITQKIDGLLCSVTDAQSNPGRQSELKGIVVKVIDLARRFRAQPATYEFTAPQSQSDEAVDFDADTMEDTKPDEGDKFLRTVQLVTFPAVMKVVNGAVSGAEEKKCVVKAKVLCESKSSL